MKRLAIALLAGALLALAIAPSASAFGLEELDLTFNGEDGSAATQAGSHPFSQTTTLALQTVPSAANPGVPELPNGDPKDLTVSLPPGLIGDPNAVERCTGVDFALERCPAASKVGTTEIEVTGPGIFYTVNVYSLTPPPGVPMEIGFRFVKVPVTIDLTVNTNPPYNVLATLHNISNAVPLYSSKLTVFGAAGDKPFLTLPRACEGPLTTSFEAFSWQQPNGPPALGTATTHDGSEPPSPLGMTGCDRLAFGPRISAAPTAKASSSPTGLDFSLDVADEGLGNPDGLAASDVRKAVVTLPEGMSINPAIAEGLEVCTEAQLARETPFSAPGTGCPEAAKIGSVSVETPLLDETVDGALYQAEPYQNPFHSLIALYMVIKNPNLGIKIVQPLNVVSDPVTGRLTTVAEELPQLPFSHFKLHFKEGTRSPLATPPGCGTYNAEATLYPWAGGSPTTTTSAFQIITGPGAGPCPKGGLPPFHPALVAGTVNNAAGRFSPFDVRITRDDSEQEITHFSIKLPPGVAGKLAGISSCPDAAIARAQGRTGPHGGAEELNDPSCPAASQVGRTLAGAGVGSALAYAPGKVYLAGPFRGAPISFVSITSGLVGPFDIGTVVVRLAIRVNPETGEVFLDSTGSDPIPHIIKGVPVHLRDIRAYTDRPQFTFNPTSCARMSTAATVLGSGLDFASGADDNPFVSTSPFQAADCAALPFEPKLSLKLLGGTKRGDFPKLKAFLRMRGFGEAGVARAQVTLPRSEFIANAHFNTICTRVQFKAAGGNGEACPSGSIYGWARAKSPILAEPLEGPVFLRSSEHQLPDVVASLRGQQIDVHLVGHVDSVKGQLRNTFETVPDAPVEWASFSFKGGSKGLFENSTNLCVGKHLADVRLTGQNGKRHNYQPAVEVKCAKAKSHKRTAR
ncbi:MAG TPA: hypothetical protein VNS60_10610 [Solirubrobacterales bacterium]|nr:hypothetical protein [Solirubrobacterales bacterium]